MARSKTKPKAGAPSPAQPDALKPSVAKALSKLTPLQKRFVVEYCGDAHGNGVVAAKQAGFTGTYRARAASASRMLRHPDVRAAITEWMDAYAMTGSEVTTAIADLATANLLPFTEVQPDGTVHVKVADADAWEAHAHWIKSIDADPKTGRVTKVTVHDSLAALRELAKILKLYTEAPALNVMLFMRSLTDDELLAQAEELRTAVRSTALVGVN